MSSAADRPDPAERPAKAERRRRRLRRGIYLLPSLLTMGNVVLGFFAIIRGLQGQFETSALAIFAAAVLDAFDGRIARLTATESEFGKEFDSLADVLTFCMVPALLTYVWGLRDLGRVGWLVPVFFLLCGATRLARFNVQTKVVDSRYFVGLPTPAAACAVGAVLYFAPVREWKTWVEGFLIFALVALGTLMVSTFRYRSFKQIDLKARWSYRVILPLAALVLVVTWDPHVFFLLVAVVYTASGPLGWLAGRLRAALLRRRAEPDAGEAA